ncbi:unnamed protein product, partial [Brenthis ino]
MEHSSTMFRLILVIMALAFPSSAIPNKMPHPAKLALLLGEEEFEDYLDKWLEIEERNWLNVTTDTSIGARSACSIRVNGDLGQPQPVYIRRSINNYLEAAGNTGIITLNSNEEVIISCPGSNRLIQHPNIASNVQTATARCVNNAFVSGPAGAHFPGVAINTVYTQVNQRNVIAGLVGNNMVDNYITTTNFLARGHLAAKSDFVFATGQRATFYFSNAAPQWQPFNAGNWNTLEQNLRRRIGVAGYDTVIYTGTFGVTQLRDASGRFVDIYLESNNRVPVPLYYYKVVYDASRRRGTAFVSINNPYYTLAEARGLQFCTDRCRDNSAFSWIGWQPDNLAIGYSFCCTIPDFRSRIGHIPNFDVSNGLLS